VHHFFHQQYVIFQGGYIGDMKLSQTLKTLRFFQAGDMAMCELLLDRGADIDAKCSWGSPTRHENLPPEAEAPKICHPQEIHPGRLTAGTYSHHPFRKENDLNQTRMIMFHVNLPGCKALSRDELLTTIIALFRHYLWPLFSWGGVFALGEAP